MDKHLFHTRLLNWYDTHRRDLPWRDTSDPYLIWISEVILQQTRVAQGMDYYLRFVSRFPDVRSLAEAPEQEVMRLWQGLGYYSRARNLHHAARQIMSQHGGRFPSSPAEVRSLKGIGPYTAAAICSFAFGACEAVVDGNVYRVLSRLLLIDEPIDTTHGQKLFQHVATDMLCTRNPATYNQAVMELGALQCVPQNPDCASCPLLDLCEAARAGAVSQLPRKQGRTRIADRYFNHLLLLHDGRFPIVQRTGHDIWQHLYQLPLIETSDNLLDADSLLSHPQLRQWIGHCGQATLRRQSAELTHVLTHRRIHARVSLIELDRPARIDGADHIATRQLEQYATSRLTERLLERLGDPEH